MPSSVSFRRRSCTCTWREPLIQDRKSTRLNSSHLVISYAVFCLKKKKHHHAPPPDDPDPAQPHLAQLGGAPELHRQPHENRRHHAHDGGGGAHMQVGSIASCSV